MAPPKVSKTAKKPASDETETEPAKTEAVDASQLNELLASVSQRLKGGLHGSFFEEGSKLDDKQRHEQLPTMFALQKQLSALQMTMEKKQQTESEQAKPDKTSAPSNKSLVATIKTVVEQQVADKFRDMSVRNERLEAALKKSEDRNEALEGSVQTLGAKLKKTEQRCQQLADRVKTIDCPKAELDQTLAKVRKMAASAGGEDKNSKLSMLERNVQAVDEKFKDKLKKTEADYQQLKNRIKTVEGRIECLEEATFEDPEDSHEDSDECSYESEDDYGGQAYQLSVPGVNGTVDRYVYSW